MREIAYMSHPDNLLFCVQNDGSMSVLTYNPTQQVRGWQRMQTNGLFDSVACGSAPTGDRDEAWVLTRRYIDGVEIRMVEYLEDVFRYGTLQEDGFFVDCGLSYDGRRKPAGNVIITMNGTTATITASGTPFVVGDEGKLFGTYKGCLMEITNYVDSSNITARMLRDEHVGVGRFSQGQWWIFDTVTTVSGLDHLNGMEVAIVGDGSVLTSRTVSGGAVTLSSPSAVVHVGLSYTSSLTTNRINAGGADGTSQGKIKRIDKAVLRVWRSLGGQVGGAESEYRDDIFSRAPQDPMDLQLPLLTGDTDILDVPSDYGKDGRVSIIHAEPLPFTLVAIMPRLVTQDGR